MMQFFITAYDGTDEGALERRKSFAHSIWKELRRLESKLVMQQNKNALLGAIIGDIAGSRFEFHNYKKKKDYNLFSVKCRYTDDTVMSLAIANALMESGPDYANLGAMAVQEMQRLGKAHPDAGYGGRFIRWIFEEDTQPYNSWGNGAAMRVSACGQLATSIEQGKMLSLAVTAVTHNHPEGLKGAEALTTAIYLAKTGHSKEEIRKVMEEEYYALDFTLDEIRKTYTFDVSCQGSVPQAIQAFLESVDFEDAIRGAISIGGDSDTIAAMCGSIAAVYYGVPKAYADEARTFLTEDLAEILDRFNG